MAAAPDVTCYVTCVACNSVHGLGIELNAGLISAAIARGAPSAPTIQTRLAGAPAARIRLIPITYDCPNVTEKEKISKVVADLPLEPYANADVITVTQAPNNIAAYKYPTRFLTPEQQVLWEFGKSVVTNSFEVLKSFIAFMVPLTTGLITAYIAILQFAGIQTMSDFTDFSKSNLMISPIFMFVSLIFFIIASFPIPRQLSMGNLQGVKKFRSDMFYWKYTNSAIGGVFFIIGVIAMILIIIPIVANEEVGGLVTYINPIFGYEIQYPSDWVLQVFNYSKSVIIEVPGYARGPQVKIDVVEFDTPPPLELYAKARLANVTGGLVFSSTIDNNLAYIIRGNTSDSSEFEVFTIKNNKAFILDYHANKSDYPIYYPYAQRMIQSFKFIG